MVMVRVMITAIITVMIIVMFPKKKNNNNVNGIILIILVLAITVIVAVKIILLAFVTKCMINSVIPYSTGTAHAVGRAARFQRCASGRASPRCWRTCPEWTCASVAKSSINYITMIITVCINMCVYIYIYMFDAGSAVAGPRCREALRGRLHPRI